MSEHLADSKYSIEHAKRRIAEFDGEVNVFLKSNPYVGGVDKNANGTQQVIKLKLTQPLPHGLKGCAFDAVNNMRSALDQAAFACAQAVGLSGKLAKFPFASDASDMQGKVTGHSRGKGKSSDIPKEIFALMAAFKPYRGGNDFLWALNELCNTQKHEIVCPMGMATGAGSAEIEPVRGSILLPEHLRPSGSIEIVARWDRRKNELIFARIEGNPQANLDIKLQVFVAMANIDVVANRPATGVLNHIAGIVDGIISGVEAEGRRIGIFN